MAEQIRAEIRCRDGCFRNEEALADAESQNARSHLAIPLRPPRSRLQLYKFLNCNRSFVKSLISTLNSALPSRILSYGSNSDRNAADTG